MGDLLADIRLEIFSKHYISQINKRTQAKYQDINHFVEDRVENADIAQRRKGYMNILFPGKDIELHHDALLYADHVARMSKEDYYGEFAKVELEEWMIEYARIYLRSKLEAEEIEKRKMKRGKGAIRGFFQVSKALENMIDN